jgi:hypothetical protein
MLALYLKLKLLYFLIITWNGPAVWRGLVSGELSVGGLLAEVLFSTATPVSLSLLRSLLLASGIRGRSRSGLTITLRRTGIGGLRSPSG